MKKKWKKKSGYMECFESFMSEITLQFGGCVFFFPSSFQARVSIQMLETFLGGK